MWVNSVEDSIIQGRVIKSKLENLFDSSGISTTLAQLLRLKTIGFIQYNPWLDSWMLTIS